MTESEQAAVTQLERLNGPLELHAAILALLLPPGSRRAVRAWKDECGAMPGAAHSRKSAGQLTGATRLPCFEMLVSRMRGRPLVERQALLEATRRVMGARGIQRPIDRLHWLAMRQRLGESTAAETHTAATAELSQLPQSDVSAIASFSAFLARMVPNEAAELEDAAPTQAGFAWYARVMAPWEKHATVPPCDPPDTARFVDALQELQLVAWMQRPTLVRGWVAAAITHSTHGKLSDVAADALRLSCSLLDSPLPPELARHYGEHVAAP
ncbi:MAG: hypothetical protein ABI702_17420 [Burkholderiales bacterium]